jgi:hypothetical protein
MDLYGPRSLAARSLKGRTRLKIQPQVSEAYKKFGFGLMNSALTTLMCYLKSDSDVQQTGFSPRVWILFSVPVIPTDIREYIDCSLARPASPVLVE